MPLRDLRAQATRRTPEELVNQLQRFALTPRFSVGIWYFSPMASRFHDKYQSDLSIEARLEKIVGLRASGVVGVEAHYPNEINEENLDLWRTWSRQSGIRVLSIVPLLFYDRQFEWGSLSSPGFEQPFGTDFAAMRDRFADGLAEAMDAVPAVRVAFEPKPYEPRGRIIYGTTAEGLLLAQKVEARLKHPENRRLLVDGHALVTLNPEIAHMLMAYEDLAYALSLICEYGRLAHTHWNSQPLGNYDQDLNVGVVAPEQAEAALYALKMAGYGEHFGIDVNPERMPVEVAVRNSIDAVRAAADRINALDHAQVIWAASHPDLARGWLEAYLIRQRAPAQSTLPPLPPLRK